LWESATASRAEVVRKEAEFIRALGANDPARGYNRWPRFDTSKGARRSGRLGT